MLAEYRKIVDLLAPIRRILAWFTTYRRAIIIEASKARGTCAVGLREAPRRRNRIRVTINACAGGFACFYFTIFAALALCARGGARGRLGLAESTHFIASVLPRVHGFGLRFSRFVLKCCCSVVVLHAKHAREVLSKCCWGKYLILVAVRHRHIRLPERLLHRG